MAERSMRQPGHTKLTHSPAMRGHFALANGCNATQTQAPHHGVPRPRHSDDHVRGPTCARLGQGLYLGRIDGGGHCLLTCPSSPFSQEPHAESRPGPSVLGGETDLLNKRRGHINGDLRRHPAPAPRNPKHPAFDWPRVVMLNHLPLISKVRGKSGTGPLPQYQDHLTPTS
jgi:hypothetical protein